MEYIRRVLVNAFVGVYRLCREWTTDWLIGCVTDGLVVGRDRKRLHPVSDTQNRNFFLQSGLKGRFRMEGFR